MANGYIGREFTQDMINGKLQGVHDLTKICEINLNLKQHMIIIAQSGGGKSYTIGVFIEEVLEKAPKQGVIAIDPIGALSSMDAPNTGKELENWNRMRRAAEIRPRAFPMQVWIPEGDKQNFDEEAYHHTYSLRADQLTVGLLCFAFGFNEFDQPMNLYRRVFAKLEKEKPEFSLHDIINEVKTGDSDFKNQTVDALASRLEILAQLKIITNAGVDIQQVVKKGEVAVFDFSQSSPITARLIMLHLMNQTLMRRLQIANKMRLAKKHNKRIRMPANYIPVTRFFLDEAREFLENNPNVELIAKKARNAGFLLTSISQSPDLPKAIYANASHFLFGGMLLENDIDGCKALVPTNKKPAEFRDMLQNLDTGQFVYYYTGDKHPVEQKILIRPRKSAHLSSTEIDDEDEWFTSGNPEDEKDLLKYLGDLGYTPKVSDIPDKYQRELKSLVNDNKIQVASEGDDEYLLPQK